MLNIYIPREPRLSNYGISEKEIPEINDFVVKPCKKARNRDSFIGRISLLVVAIAIYCYFFKTFYDIRGIINIQMLLLPIVYVFALFPVYLIALPPLKIILNFIIPKFLIHDTPEQYDDKTLLMIKKKEKLKEYYSKHSEWEKEINEIKFCFPDVLDFIPPGTDVKSILYRECEYKYITHFIKTHFIPRFEEIAELADKKAGKEWIKNEKRKQEDFWKQLSATEFEEEVAEWYRNKGYKAIVTQAQNDGGVDIILEKGGVLSYVQCKHWGGSVPVDVVRSLYGVMALNNVKNGSVVCFKATSGSYDFAGKSGIRIVTMADLIKGANSNITTKQHQVQQRILVDLRTAFWYGNEYMIKKRGWRNVSEYKEYYLTIKDNFDSSERNNIACALFKCNGLYLGVQGKRVYIDRLTEADYIIEFGNGEIVYEKPAERPKINTRNYKSHRKNRKRGGGWYYFILF